MSKFPYITIAVLFVFGCSSNIPEDIQQIIANTPNGHELKKLIKHYSATEDSLELQAAYFLIRNMDDQHFYEGKSVEVFNGLYDTLEALIKNGAINPRRTWDSIISANTGIDMSSVETIKDIDVISSDLLINNIDDAFKAWRYPWAAELTFEEFCKYILPYKLKDERPENWRGEMMRRYSWVIDTLKDKANVREVVSMINDDLQKWFYVNSGFKAPGDLSCTDLLRIKMGTCAEATQLAAYAMRAMGIPVTLDFTPFWANKGGGHSWNCLLYKKSSLIFMGVEANPGLEKIENSGYNFMGYKGMNRKRAKIYRYSFDKNHSIIDTSIEKNISSLFSSSHFEDVTGKFVNVSDVLLKLDANLEDKKFGYLAVFNNREWKPIHWGRINSQKEVLFTSMGRDIVYLPMVNHNQNLIAASDAFILLKNGAMKILHPDLQKRQTVIIDRKYPEDISNKIIPGNNYEMYYWNKEWKSLGVKKADEDYLTYDNIPANALLFIRNLDAGFQERIFTVENGKQIWW